MFIIRLYLTTEFAQANLGITWKTQQLVARLARADSTAPFKPIPLWCVQAASSARPTAPHQRHVPEDLSIHTTSRRPTRLAPFALAASTVLWALRIVGANFHTFDDDVPAVPLGLENLAVVTASDSGPKLDVLFTKRTSRLQRLRRRR